MFYIFFLGASTSAAIPPNQFLQDPIYPPIDLLSTLHRENWRTIRTRQSRGNRVQDWYNSLNMGELVGDVERIFQDQTTVFKLNLSFGFVLFNNDTEEMQYHHSSANNNRVFDTPFLVRSREDLQQVRSALENLDVFEWARQQRPNSKWIVVDITNATFYVTKLRDHPIGRSTRLPKYVLENPAVVSLDCNEHTGLPYEHKLCFFRCLALHRGYQAHNSERDTQHYFERYADDVEDFDGVTLEELPDLEKLFELNIYVYRLVECEDEDTEKTEIVAQLIQRSHRNYANTMYLNLYGSHFSYIKNLKMYSKSYCCSKCDKLWKTAKALNQHEKTCKASVRHVFPGGAYKVPQTIFDLLEDEGNVIPEELKYFPYRATFDFECYFKKGDQHPKNTAKLTWEAEHVPLSVSVCSNVPGYDQLKCFVSSGSAKEMIKQFVEYLVQISQESYALLLDRFSDVFEQINERIANSEVCCVFDHLGMFETCTYCICMCLGI